MNIEESWMHGEVHGSPFLKEVVEIARRALIEGEESLIRAVWHDLDLILDEWVAKEGKHPRPFLYDLAFGIYGIQIPRWKYADTNYEDDADLLRHIIKSKDEGLLRFCPPEYHWELWAVLVLREAANGNAYAAMKAHNRLAAHFVFKYADAARLKYRNAGMARGEKLKEQGASTRKAILEEVKRFQQEGRPPRSINSLVANKLGIKHQHVSSIRRKYGAENS